MLFCRGIRSNRVIQTSVKKDHAGTSGATREADTVDGIQSKITHWGDIMLVLVQCKNVELAQWWIYVVLILWDFRPKVLKTDWGLLKMVLCSRSVKARCFPVTVTHQFCFYLFHSKLKICGYKNHTSYFLSSSTMSAGDCKSMPVFFFFLFFRWISHCSNLPKSINLCHNNHRGFSWCLNKKNACGVNIKQQQEKKWHHNNTSMTFSRNTADNAYVKCLEQRQWNNIRLSQFASHSH